MKNLLCLIIFVFAANHSFANDCSQFDGAYKLCSDEDEIMEIHFKKGNENAQDVFNVYHDRPFRTLLIKSLSMAREEDNFDFDKIKNENKSACVTGEIKSVLFDGLETKETYQLIVNGSVLIFTSKLQETGALVKMFCRLQ